MENPEAADLLVLGGSGFIGARVAQMAIARGMRVACTHRNRPVPPGAAAFNVDICDADSSELAICLSITRPKTVIHCAVTYADDDNEQMRVSYGSLQALINGMRIAGLESRILYLSTNAVFSGHNGPNKETDVPDAELRTDHYRSYGMARLAGERLALENWPDAVVVRTANVDGRDAWGQINPRLVGLIEPLRAGMPLQRYTDRVISPTLVDNLAEGLLEVANPAFIAPLATGKVLHISGRQPMTDFEYARRLARVLGVPDMLIQPDHILAPGAPERYDISLDVAYTQSLLNTHMMDVEEMLAAMFTPHPPTSVCTANQPPLDSARE